MSSIDQNYDDISENMAKINTNSEAISANKLIIDHN